MEKKYPFQVEFTPKSPQIYHGPKKRMKDCLTKFTQTGRLRMTQTEFLEYILSEYKELAISIQKVKFYEYQYGEDTLHFAILWVSDSASARDELFEKGPEITAQTGWYPLITGSRIGRKAQAADIHIRESLRKCMNRSKFEASFDLGSPLSIERAYEGAGNSILLKTTNWNILLDTGAEPRKLRMDKLDKRKKTIVILSHAHTDHVGGLLNIIQDRNFFIISTEITLDLILNRCDHIYGLKNILPKNFFYRVFPARYDCVYHFTSGGSLSFFYSSHYPGSAMILLAFSNGRTLLYTGDFSISPAYGEGARAQLLNPDSFFWQASGDRLDWAIVDAALASRGGEVPSLSKTEVLERIDSLIQYNGSAVFFAEPQDCGLFLYFDLFARYLSGTKSWRVPIYVDPLVKRQLNTLDKYLKLKWVHALWPELQEFVTKRVTPCDSVWLFEMKANWSANFDRHQASRKPTLFILDFDRVVKDCYGDVRAFSKLMSKADLICIVSKVLGHSSLKEMYARKLLRTSKVNISIAGEVLLLDEVPWMPHCTRNELEEILQCVKTRIENVLFFHGRVEALEQLAKDISTRIDISARGLPDSPIPL